MSELYPLLFRPVFKERVWGGRSLSRWYEGMPPGPVGEAWVLSGHKQGLTPVANGPLAGKTLPELQQQFGTRLLGSRGVSGKTGSFPLLFKLLDAWEDLSVQVHPSDDYPGLPPGELGKTEMWVVLGAEPGAQAIYGLRPDIGPEGFARAVAADNTMSALRQLQVRPGDVLFVPAGTVHALGAGLLVAEIQQSSDTVYRVYDYGRPGLDGKPRELHTAHALKVTSYGPPPTPARLPETEPNHWVHLCRCPYFLTEYATGAGDWAQEADPESFQVVLVLSGTAEIHWGDGTLPVPAGHAALVPAESREWSLKGNYGALKTRVPSGS